LLKLFLDDKYSVNYDEMKWIEVYPQRHRFVYPILFVLRLSNSTSYFNILF